MAVVLEERMTRSAQSHVTSITLEYESQRKWIGFYNVAADAQKSACTAVETVITNAQKKHEYYAQLAMMGLSLISGVVLAGLATVVEKNLCPLMQNTEIRLLRNKYRIPRILLVVAPPNSYKIPTAVGAAVLAGDFVSFKTQLQELSKVARCRPDGFLSLTRQQMGRSLYSSDLNLITGLGDGECESAEVHSAARLHSELEHYCLAFRSGRPEIRKAQIVSNPEAEWRALSARRTG